MLTDNENKKLFFQLINDSSDDDCGDDCNNDKCLISGDKLSDNHITLKCNHAFNYIPLLKEVITQKTTKNVLSITTLRKSEIQCPYCRTIQRKLLPYVPTKEYPSPILNVNSPLQLCMEIHTCEWIYKSGKNKGNTCNAGAYQHNSAVYCHKHHIIANKSSKSNDTWTEEMLQYKKYKISELKEMLRVRKLKVSGNKYELITRLVT